MKNHMKHGFSGWRLIQKAKPWALCDLRISASRCWPGSIARKKIFTHRPQPTQHDPSPSACTLLLSTSCLCWDPRQRQDASAWDAACRWKQKTAPLLLPPHPVHRWRVANPARFPAAADVEPAPPRTPNFNAAAVGGGTTGEPKRGGLLPAPEPATRPGRR